jgi:hypothetical protein
LTVEFSWRGVNVQARHDPGPPAGVAYPLTVDHELCCCISEFVDLGLDVVPVLEQFAEHVLVE